MTDKIQIGDLIKTKNRRLIRRYLISNQIFVDDSDRKISDVFSDVRFGRHDVGVVTGEKKIRNCTYYQILTCEGSGWIYNKIVERVVLIYHEHKRFAHVHKNGIVGE